MSPVHINYSDLGGGAARAAYRLHRGLLGLGQCSRMIVKTKLSSDEEVISVGQPLTYENKGNVLFSDAIQNFIDTHRTSISNTFFSFSYPGMDVSQLPEVAAADVINLHWVAYRYQSPATLKKLFALNKPVVWTLHDQWAFTGGCHYSAGCQNYKSACDNCPQLSDPLFELPSKILQDKIDLFRGADLTIVTPSLWLKQCAQESKLFGKLRVEAIPNSLDTEVFIPINKKEAKQKIGLADNTIALLFGADNGGEKRKGYRELLQALEYCTADPAFNALLARKQVTMLIFGNPAEELTKTGIPIRSMGYVDSDQQLAEIYSAADVFLLPSLEDNLPNTMLESMSCGTPVVAFEVGGMKDVIKNNITGKLAPEGNAREFGKAILDLLSDPTLLRQMSDNCRPLVEIKFRLSTQAAAYLSLYRELSRKSVNMHVQDDLGSEKQLSSNYALEEDVSTGKYYKSIEYKIIMKLWLTKQRSALKEYYLKKKRISLRSYLRDFKNKCLAFKNRHE